MGPIHNALVFHGEASFDKHQLGDFLQMCVTAAQGDDILSTLSSSNPFDF